MYVDTETHEHISFINFSSEEIILLTSVFCYCISYKSLYHWTYKYLLNASYIKIPVFVPQGLKNVQVTIKWATWLEEGNEWRFWSVLYDI